MIDPRKMTRPLTPKQRSKLKASYRRAEATWKAGGPRSSSANWGMERIEDILDKDEKLRAGYRPGTGGAFSFSRNPKQLLFRTRAAAVKYAREHGAKRYSIRKLRTAK